MRSFKDWLAERSATDTARRMYALGLGPAMPDAALHTRSTCPPGLLELIEKRKKKKKKRKKKRKKRVKVHEAKEDIKPDYSIDKWLRAVDRLKKDLEEEEEELKKRPKDDDLKLGDEDFEDDEFEELEDDEEDEGEEEDEELEDDEEFDLEPPNLLPPTLGRRTKDAEIPGNFGEMPI